MKEEKKELPFDSLTAVTPVDGRYADKTVPLREVFSEYGLIARRVKVEIAWLAALCDESGVREAKKLTPKERALLFGLSDKFSIEDARRVKAIEAVTRHDVKAIEYFIKEKLKGTQLEKLSEFIHFACTSEDINNMAHGLMLKDGLAVLRRAQNHVLSLIDSMARNYAALPMLAHTHGQPASPTTLGKEMAVFVNRLRRQGQVIDDLALPAKMNGAVGNYNAHLTAYPAVDWPKVSKRVIHAFGLAQNPLTTQIESHDGMAELFDAITRWNTILIDFDRDIWSYISMGYIKQKVVKGEVGSSTMPHKVNPIDFENSEGNLGVANALFEHMARKLPISRLQRDLTDSTVLRNMGSAFAYTLIACHSTIRGLGRITPNEEALAADLNDAWEVLAEPVQTVMRRFGIPEPYEKLKEFTRGQKITAESMHRFIASLAIPETEKKRLETLTPAAYVGIAVRLVKDL